MAQPDRAMIERLRSLMRERNINARTLAEQAAVGKSFVYDILNSKSTNPTTKKLSAVAAVLKVSLSYLLTGKESESSGHFLIPPSPGADDGDAIVHVPLLEVDNSKGATRLQLKEEHNKPYCFSAHWLKQAFGAAIPSLRLVEVRGDSMQPTLSQGDVVLIDVSNTHPSPTGLFVVFDGTNLQVKRVEASAGGDTFRFSSDNGKYYPYEMPREESHIVGRVLWFARAL